MFVLSARELTGAEKSVVAVETDIDAEEAPLPLPDSTVEEFNRGVTDLDGVDATAKTDHTQLNNIDNDKKVWRCVCVLGGEVGACLRGRERSGVQAKQDESSIHTVF